MIVVIDGPAGTGKSSVASILADKIGFIHFETGAMYRAITYFLMENNVDFLNENEVTNKLNEFDLKIVNKKIIVNEVDITDFLRSATITKNVIKVAAIGYIRKFLVNIQKKLASNVNSVFEGRDMGTVVFPNADIKIFMTASCEERATRRFKELKGEEDFNSVLESIKQRDEADINRKISPLKQADDAILVDTTNMSIEEVVCSIEKLVKNAL